MPTRVLQPTTEILNPGTCEPLKAGVHSALLLLAAVCAAYNTAAWFKRRQPHLAVNAVIYTTAVLWERCHVQHHVAALALLEAIVEERPKPRLVDAA